MPCRGSAAPHAHLPIAVCAMAALEQPKGYLVIKVLEVTGKSKEDEAVWDSSLKDAFIKSGWRSLFEIAVMNDYRPRPCSS